MSVSNVASNKKIVRIIALTKAGGQLAKKIQQHIPNASVWLNPQPFAQEVQNAFLAGEKLIFICATGIVFRCLAPVLRDKYQDPPVLVIDESGSFVIPVLSGHEGGANQWAYEIANLLSAQPVITTANPYLNPIYTVGMGCERHCPLSYLETLLLQSLEQAGLHIEQVESIHSIDIKSDETGLILLAEKYNKPFHTWSVKQLATMESFLSVKSDYVFNTVGVYGVAESACLFAASDLSKANAELLLTKQKNEKATCAIARSFLS